MEWEIYRKYIGHGHRGIHFRSGIVRVNYLIYGDDAFCKVEAGFQEKPCGHGWRPSGVSKKPLEPPPHQSNIDGGRCQVHWRSYNPDSPCAIVSQ